MIDKNLTSASKILVCEDMDAQRLMLTQLLENEGFLVTACNNGEKTIEVFETDTFDLVLLDVNLPGMDGLEVFHELQSRKRTVSVIMMTAFSSVEQSVKAFKMGAINYLAKPFFKFMTQLL